MTDAIVKQADKWMDTWAREIRSGNRIDLGASISSVYAQRVKGSDNKGNLAGEVDRIIGTMQQPMQRVVRRYYLDEIPGRQFTFYPENSRPLEEKARDEGMTTTQFKDYLKIGRHIVYDAMTRSEFHAA